MAAPVDSLKRQAPSIGIIHMKTQTFCFHHDTSPSHGRVIRFRAPFSEIHNENLF